MRKFQYILKEISGGQNLTPRHRAIFMWWAMSLTLLLIFGESLVMAATMFISFGFASYFMGELPTPEENEEDWFDD